MSVALLFAAAFEAPRNQATNGQRSLTERALADVVQQGRAAQTNGRDVQLRFTWVGPQSEIVPTVVLGTRGHRLDMAKYAPLRVAGLHYGNDDPDLVQFVQLDAAAWRAIFDALDEADVRERFDAPPDDVDAHVRHVTISIGDRNGRSTRFAQALTPLSDTFVASMCALLERPELNAVDVAPLLRAH